MTIRLIGSAVADWDTREEVLFPAVDVKEGKGYLFFIRAQTAGAISVSYTHLTLPTILLV